ncbi:hypothetical protein HDV06_000443 [Boothiomyces sp. JEL0866]|nr:hypothetical protein HDV06_000443 [Boothiomyces sp. JEL0866]
MAQFLEYNWLSSDCTGPPSSIFHYIDDSNSTVLNYMNNDVGYFTCTPYAHIDPRLCCKSSLDTTATLGYQASSGSYDFSDNAFIDLWNSHYFPISTSNQNYCTINGGLAEYSTGYYLADGACYEGYIRCLSNKLYIYHTPKCIGVAEEYDLQVEGNFTSDIIGSFTGKMTLFSTGIYFYTWIAYYPSALYYPLNKNPVELLGTICQLLNISAPLFGIIFYIYKMCKMRKPYFLYIVIIMNLIWWLLFGLTFMYSNYSVMTTDESNANLSLSFSLPIYFQNTAILFGILSNFYILNKLVLKLSTWNSRILFALCFLLHYGLSGFVLMEYPAIYSIYQYGDPRMYILVNKWSRSTAFLHILIWFMFGFITTSTVTLYIVRYDSKYKSLAVTKKLIRVFQNSSISLPVVFQFLNLMLYFIVYYIMNFTILAGNDRTQSGLSEIASFLITLGMLINSFNYDYFKITLNHAVRNRGKSVISSQQNVKEQPLQKLVHDSAIIQSVGDKSTINDKATVLNYASGKPQS